MTKSVDLSNAEFKGKVLATLEALSTKINGIDEALSDLRKSWIALEEGKVSDLLKRVAIIEGSSSGTKMTWEKVITILSLLIAASSVVIVLIQK